jgi:hypothetical protein
MKQVRTLTVVFDNELKPFEIPAFRGAVVAKVGRENILFHHHLDDSRFLNKYPCIQYKSLGGKPAIFCLEEGVDEMYKFFTKRDWSVEVSGRNLDLKVNRLDLKQINLQVWDKQFSYRISSWIALNSENYRLYQTLKDEEEKKKFLTGKMISNIISLAKGVGWHIDKQIEINIKTILKEKPVKLKDIKVLAFDLEFSSNVFLPDNIGLGKSVSHGYGIVKQNRSINHGTN